LNRTWGLNEEGEVGRAKSRKIIGGDWKGKTDNEWLDDESQLHAETKFSWKLEESTRSFEKDMAWV